MFRSSLQPIGQVEIKLNKSDSSETESKGDSISVYISHDRHYESLTRSQTNQMNKKNNNHISGEIFLTYVIGTHRDSLT